MQFRGSAALLFLMGCATLTPVPEAWRSVPQAARITDLCARVTCAPRSAADVKVADGKLVASGKNLTPQFRAIQSFDVSLERREVAFSAKRSDNFDIGLVSLDGSDIHWVPEDPADETDVQWAPRGNKISFVVHLRTGDLVRTVHIPTSFQLTADFPYTAVRALGWELAAERYAVVLTSPEASERIERLEYSGEGRESVVAPAVRLDVSIEPLADALLMRPSTLRYGERLPLVVWITETPFEWNDARGALMRNARLACAIVRQPSDAFWTVARALAWIDMEKVYVVGAGEGAGARAPPNTSYIVPTGDLPVDRYRIRDHALLVAPGSVESVAAGWIAQQLKDRNGPR
jgi:hypothetical protein